MKKRTLLFGSTIAAFALVAAGCGDSKESSSSGSSDSSAAARSDACKTLKYVTPPSGGDLVDIAQLAGGPDNSSFDPQMVQTLDESQITAALFDGLTDIDFTDTCNPELKPLVAEKWSANDDATEFTFTIKKTAVFSNGEKVKPSNFKKAWERGGNAELASPYGYLVTYIKGGDKLQSGDATTLDSVVADDDARTLKVTLAAPNADFPQIVMHPFFSPITDSEAKKFATTTGWGFEGVTIGNGPFKLKSAGAPDSGTVVIERNDKWGGSILGDKKAALDTITFKISANVQGSYQAFESGEGDTATIPSGQFKTAMASHKNTVAEGQLGTYYFDFGFADPQLGGKKNTKLRQAISMAIDRNEINNKVYEGTRVISTGITPPGIPGFKADLCKYCKTDEVAAKKLFDEWTAAGGKLTAPIKLSFNVTGGHDVVAQIIQSNLKRVLGIDAELNPIETGYFGAIAEEGACQLCRAGWLADYPTYGNFMVDLFGKASIDQNNLGRYNDPEFEKLVAAAQKEPDTTKRAELYQKAEDHLLNVTTGAIPLNWYTGDEVYSDKLVNFSQPPLGLILWEKVGKK